MVYRKGELTSAGIDRDWPHQVALSADYVCGRQYMILHRFCNGLSCARDIRASQGRSGVHRLLLQGKERRAAIPDAFRR